MIAAQLEAIRDNVKTLEKEIAAFVKTMPGYDNLISIKGIGALSAAVMLTHIGEITDFKDTGKLAAFFGIVPRVSQSNASCNIRHITKRGSKIARKSLVQCTLIAKRTAPICTSSTSESKPSAEPEKLSLPPPENYSTPSSTP